MRHPTTNVKEIPGKSRNGMLLPKLFWCTVIDKNLLKFKAEGREFAKFLRPLEPFIQTVKGQKKFC